MNYSAEEIEHAKKVGAFNAKEAPKSETGFWFKDIYIISIFLDITGENGLTFDESVAYYGAENVKHFMELARLQEVN